MLTVTITQEEETESPTHKHVDAAATHVSLGLGYYRAQGTVRNHRTRGYKTVRMAAEVLF